MDWQQLIIDVLRRSWDTLEKALTNLSQDDLNKQPHPDSNSMGWLTWHLSRTQDRAIASITGDQQIWIKDNWYTKFHLSADTQDTGFGHTSQDVTKFKSPKPETLLEYYRAVLGRTEQYLVGLSTTELERKLDHPRVTSVEAWLAAVLYDTLQHSGQVAYLRGLLKGKGWWKG